VFAEHLASRTRVGLAVAAALTTACAPDAWRSDPGYNGWTNRIIQECYPRSIGGAQLSTAFMQPAFLDLTSQRYFRKIDANQYADSVNSFYPGDNRAAIGCIESKLPPLVSPTIR
jgi:hypothetical protein